MVYSLPVELEEAHERPRGGAVDEERQHRDPGCVENDLVSLLLLNLMHAYRGHKDSKHKQTTHKLLKKRVIAKHAKKKK